MSSSKPVVLGLGSLEKLVNHLITKADIQLLTILHTIVDRSGSLELMRKHTIYECIKNRYEKAISSGSFYKALQLVNYFKPTNTNKNDYVIIPPTVFLITFSNLSVQDQVQYYRECPLFNKSENHSL